MNYDFSLIVLELSVPVISTIIAAVGIILYAYIYFKLYEETQFIVLFIGVLSFIFSILETINIIISLSNLNSKLAFQLFKYEQIVFTLTIIPWIIFIKNKLKLNEQFHSMLEKTYMSAVFIIILICSISLLYPQLFISTEEPSTFFSQTIKTRGLLGPIYIFRDFLFTIYSSIVICALLYEIINNKKVKEYLYILILFLLISISFFDDFNGMNKYSNNFLLFPKLVFSRVTLAYAIFNIFMIYFSVGRFISAVYKKGNKSYDLESIKAQDYIIISAAITTSEKLSKIKENFSNSVNELVRKVENAYSTINNLKNDINKIIDYTTEFIAVETFQINDGNKNIEKINELIETYTKLKEFIELQKKVLEDSNTKIQESIEKVYNLQGKSKFLIENFELFQKHLKDEQNNFLKEFEKEETFKQLSIQINKIISFMSNMSDKTKTLAINSSIQASKSGEWYGNFSVVSKQVGELVLETTEVTNQMQELLSKIEDIFKKFNNSSNLINNNIHLLTEDISNNYDNMNIIKSTDKIYSSISNITNIVSNEENDFINIREKIEEINAYIKDILDKSLKQNYEIKNLMRDMNKLLATSNDLEDITESLDSEMNRFVKCISDLETKIDEYSKVV